MAVIFIPFTLAEITIGFTEDYYVFPEYETNGVLRLAIDSGIISERNDISVRLSLLPNGTATEGRDFRLLLLDSVIEFAPGVQSVFVPLEILEDPFLEGMESFVLTVESAGFGFYPERMATFSQTTIFIIDDDNGMLYTLIFSSQ